MKIDTGLEMIKRDTEIEGIKSAKAVTLVPYLRPHFKLACPDRAPTYFRPDRDLPGSYLNYAYTLALANIDVASFGALYLYHVYHYHVHA